MTPTTYGYDTAYCLKSHCGVRGCCRQSGYFSLNLSDNSVMRGRIHARRTLKGLVADLRIISTVQLETIPLVRLKSEALNVNIFHVRSIYPSECLKRLKRESCLITKRNLPSFSQKSGNFLFVIRQLDFLDRNECNKISSDMHRFITLMIEGAVRHRTYYLFSTVRESFRDFSRASQMSKNSTSHPDRDGT